LPSAELHSQPPPISARGALYYDSGGINLGDFVDNRPYEWRTPPLWGLADSGPYLHDGRVATVRQAIERHGGQAARAARMFRELSDADRQALLAFLSTLIAPEAAYLKRPLAQLDHPPGRQPSLLEAVEKQRLDERAASGRLRLALAARDRGDADTAHRWLEAVVNGFPTTKAAQEASALLSP
jgi:hypothetical protein